MMRQLGETLNLEMHVYGPEMHVTGIVPMALKGEKADKYIESGLGRVNSNSNLSMTEQLFYGQINGPTDSTAKPSSPSSSAAVNATATASANGPLVFPDSPQVPHPWYMPFTSQTRAFIYGMQPRAVQGMLDFDYMCNRESPSVAAMIYPFGGHHVQKFYWGTKETLLSVFTSIEEAMKRFPEVDTVVNFASFRSVYESTMDLMNYPQIKTISIIAEGVPEKRARQLLHVAKDKKVLIIGPATVGEFFF